VVVSFILAAAGRVFAIFAALFAGDRGLYPVNCSGIVFIVVLVLFVHYIVSAKKNINFEDKKNFQWRWSRILVAFNLFSAGFSIYQVIPIFLN
jgi:Ca2+/Na+ antiporter